MLRLLEPTLTFKGEDCREFLKKHDNGLDLLPKFLENPTVVPENIIRLQVVSFKNPLREIAWIFMRITGQETTTIFNWGEFISIEISSQLSQCKKEKKLFMSSYFIFSIVH
jgi:hypothetical protein